MIEKELSVIIVCYNCLPLIKQCIESIDRFNDIGDGLEIIVVDNSEDSSTFEWLRSERPDIIAIDNENKGFGHGNNVGVVAASGRYLLFLNPDTILIEPIFAYAVKKFDSDPKLGVFGVRLLDADRKRTDSFGLRFVMGAWLTALNDLLVSAEIFIPSKMFILGADIFIRRDTFIQAGLFDENIFMYCEEADLCNRVNDCGMKNRYFREKSLIHLEGKTQASPNVPRTYQRVTESRRYYCQKNGLDFRKYLKKELRYCRFKKAAFGLTGKTKQADDYKKIVKYIRQTLRTKTKNAADLQGKR